jgi:phosphate starvation-inducible PhoH-like protein
LKEIYLPLTVNPVEFYGVNDRNLTYLKDVFPKLRIVARGEVIKVSGEDDLIHEFEKTIIDLLDMYETKGVVELEDIKMHISGEVVATKDEEGAGLSSDVIVHGQHGIIVKARTPGQKRMVVSSRKNDIVFAIGPAGTGKTYTAVALAVKALRAKEVKRIILTRPAVEAGESLGFLPGDLREKIDPYLRPLYDALYDMLPAAKVKSFVENGVIEVAPLAFMRGRTLDHAFVILDESQNTTMNQLKMFLTRMGPSAKFILTGDITQVDLPKQQPSGLIHGINILKDIRGIDFVFLDKADVVRHKLVKDIIHAYSGDPGEQS